MKTGKVKMMKVSLKKYKQKNISKFDKKNEFIYTIFIMVCKLT